MSKWLVIILLSVVLGAALSSTTYFIKSVTTEYIPCTAEGAPSNDQNQRTRETTENGFPLTFRKHISAVKSCENADALAAGSASKGAPESTVIYKNEFINNCAIWIAICFPFTAFSIKGIKR